MLVEKERLNTGLRPTRRPDAIQNPPYHETTPSGFACHPAL